MKKISCNQCKECLSNDEIAINIKLLGKQIATLRCYGCLSNILSCPEQELIKRTKYFKEMGCQLFYLDYIGQRGSVSR